MSGPDGFRTRFPWALTLTMNQVIQNKDGEREFLTPELASQGFRLFRMKLNDELLGRRWSERGDGIRVIPLVGGLTSYSLGNRDDLWWDSEEGGSRITQHIHYHCSLGPELGTHTRGHILSEERTTDEVTDLVQSIYQRTSVGKGINQLRVERTRDTGWLSYSEDQEPVIPEEVWQNLDIHNFIPN